MESVSSFPLDNYMKETSRFIPLAAPPQYKGDLSFHGTEQKREIYIYPHTPAHTRIHRERGGDNSQAPASTKTEAEARPKVRAKTMLILTVKMKKVKSAKPQTIR